MSNKRKQITALEHKQLEERLDYLILEARKEVIERIKIARSYGDLSENSEYDAAKDEQRHIEQEIKDIESLLRTVEIISEDAFQDEIVSIGKTVELEMGDSGTNEIFHLVGNKPDIFSRKITIDSPVGQAINGKTVGDISQVYAPNGMYYVKIVSIERTKLPEAGK